MWRVLTAVLVASAAREACGVRYHSYTGKLLGADEERRLAADNLLP